MARWWRKGAWTGAMQHRCRGCGVGFLTRLKHGRCDRCRTFRKRREAGR